MDVKVYKGKCRRCGKELTAKESVRKGYGKTCWLKLGFTTLTARMKDEKNASQRKVVCAWCGEELKFVDGKGWLHLDGKLYKTKIIDGEEIDDHCALPKFE